MAFFTAQYQSIGSHAIQVSNVDELNQLFNEISKFNPSVFDINITQVIPIINGYKLSIGEIKTNSHSTSTGNSSSGTQDSTVADSVLSISSTSYLVIIDVTLKE